MAFLEDVMKQLLDFVFSYTNSYGLAIIVLTVFIKLILLPFSFQQFNQMKKIQEIAPKQQEIQKKYKNDQEKMNRELMKLYQDNNVNPMGGCLPMLIQFPFIIALFRLLQSYNFGQAGFLWIKDLGAPDSLYILPILAAVTTFFQSKLASPPNPDTQNNTMNIFMSLFIGWMAVKFASGLALYWVTGNVIQILQQKLIMRSSSAPVKEDVK
jgi:YidC/Oxa1 family membrane protein insertase